MYAQLRIKNPVCNRKQTIYLLKSNRCAKVIRSLDGIISLPGTCNERGIGAQP
jgi:hypothetical protein